VLYRYIIIIFRGLTMYKAARQSIVTILTIEAALLALSKVVKKIIAIKHFFTELILELAKA
jgi:hypothetical protein